jgi:hypothetical protein
LREKFIFLVLDQHGLPNRVRLFEIQVKPGLQFVEALVLLFHELGMQKLGAGRGQQRLRRRGRCRCMCHRRGRIGRDRKMANPLGMDDPHGQAGQNQGQESEAKRLPHV